MIEIRVCLDNKCDLTVYVYKYKVIKILFWDQKTFLESIIITLIYLHCIYSE